MRRTIMGTIAALGLVGGSAAIAQVPQAPAPGDVVPDKVVPEDADINVQQRGSVERQGTVDLNTADEALRSRYRNMNGEWWFQLSSGKWVYWRDGRWNDFDPATYVPPDGGGPPAEVQSGTTYYQAPQTYYDSSPGYYYSPGYYGGYGGYPGGWGYGGYGRGYGYGGSGLYFQFGRGGSGYWGGGRGGNWGGGRGGNWGGGRGGWGGRGGGWRW